MIPHEDQHDGSTSGYFPRIVLCIPGSWNDAADLAGRLAEGPLRWEGPKLRSVDGGGSFDAEFRGPDLRMRSAFQASACRVRPSLTAADYSAIQAHRSVVYVLSDAYGRSTAAAWGLRMVEVARALLDAGGIAVKCESSGIAHSALRWRELAARSEEPWAPLFDAYVRLPIIDDNRDLYSCGMHLLGGPDAQLALGQFPEEDIRSAYRVLEGFLRELRSDPLAGTQELQRTFKGEGAGERFLAVREACARYAEDDFFWNRWGTFRLTRA